jgi:FixJ family two-component response regulator
MGTSAGEIFIVDDDAGVRTVLSTAFTREGYQVASFSDGGSFLACARVRTPLGIILDVHIPDKSGLDILKELNAQDYPAPIFIMSGHGDIPMAVEAIKSGALDFIEKPFRIGDVIARVREAIAAHARRKRNDESSERTTVDVPGREPLTPRERDVLAKIVAGASSKEAALQLGISFRTIEVHRANIMQKLGAKNVADLIRIVMSQGH